jgi:hypothetical protein
MKKIILATSVLILASSICMAGGPGSQARKEARRERKELKKEKKAESKTEVSYSTEMHFATDFPGAQNVVFGKTKNFDEATFVYGNKIMRAYYDGNNNLIGTTKSVPVSALPATAQKKIAQKYSGYAISHVILFDDNEENATDMTLFGNTFEDEDNYFAELTKGDHDIIVRADMRGEVSLFKELR